VFLYGGEEGRGREREGKVVRRIVFKVVVEFGIER